MLEARILLQDGALLEISLKPRRQYTLRFGIPGSWLVVYENARRSVRGRAEPYEFRSVEQMRYDFERDVEEAQAAHR